MSLRLLVVFTCLLGDLPLSSAHLVARAQPAISLPTDAPSLVHVVDDALTTDFAEPLHAQLLKRAELKELDGYTHLGCWQDGSNNILSVTQEFDNGMTPELCRNVCSIAKCNMFGVEQGYHCYCGNSIEAFAVSATDDSCTATCWGADDVICGGRQRINVYSATTDFPAGKQFGVDGSGTRGTAGATSTKRNGDSSSTSTSESNDSNSNSNSDSSSSSSGGLSTGAIVGIVVGIAALLILAAGTAAFFFCCRRRIAPRAPIVPAPVTHEKPLEALAPQPYHPQPSPVPSYTAYTAAGSHGGYAPVGSQELPNSTISTIHEMGGSR